MCGRLDIYIDAFSNLPDVPSAQSSRSDREFANLDRPLLLLSVMDMFDNKFLTGNYIEPNAELDYHFQGILSQFPFIQGCTNFVQAFLGLQATKFWILRKKQNSVHLFPNNTNSLEQLRQHYWGAKFSNDLFPLLIMEGSRKKLKQTVIETYLLKY